MRLGVLGPLTVENDSGPVTIGSDKQRLLLALLITRIARPVSRDLIVETLWPHGASSSPRKAVNWHVMKLRQALGPAVTIDFRDGGYVLTADDDVVDVRRFRRLCDRGSRLAGSDPAQAAALLRQALELWRGPALDGLDAAGSLESARAEWEQLRLVALEQRIAADLDCGRHNEVAAELEALVEAHPFREALRSQLMLALYRSGRRDAALDAYRRGQELLADQHGLDASPGLKELRQRILRRDPSLAASPTDAGPPPAQLPADVAGFTGREQIVSRITGLLSAPPGNICKVVALSGAGGIGKSALAIHIAHRVVSHYPDGALYIDLHGATPHVKPVRASEAATRFLRSLHDTGDLDTDNTDELSARFRTITAHQRLLILLDNAPAGSHIRHLVPASPGSAVVVTSRSPLPSLDNALHVDLDVLAESESIALLRNLLGTKAGDHDAAARLVTLCDGLPLALRLCAARIAMHPNWTIERMVKRLRDEDRRLDELSTGDRAVRSSLMAGYHEFHDEDPEAGRMFRLVSLLDCADVSVELAAAIAEVDHVHAEQLLDRLVEHRFLAEPVPGRYRAHDLVRLFGRERALHDEPAGNREHALTIMSHFCLASARNALRAIHPELDARFAKGPQELLSQGRDFASTAAADAFIEQEFGNLDSLLRQATTVTDAAAIAGLTAIATLKVALSVRGRRRALVELGEFAIASAQRLGDPALLATAHFDVGDLRSQMGHLAEARTNLERAIVLYEQSGNASGALDTTITASIALRHQGELSEAARLARSACDMANTAQASLGSRSGAFEALGFALWQLGETTGARRAFERSVELCETPGNPANLAIALGNLGQFLTSQAEHGQALRLFERSLRIDEECGQTGTLIEADHHWGIADVHRELADHDRAGRHRRRSVEILSDIKEISGEEREALLAGDHPERPHVLR